VKRRDVFGFRSPRIRAAAAVRHCLAFGLAMIVLSALFAAGIPAADSPPAAPARKNPFEGKADAIAQGGKLFDEKCSECHGDGTGMTAPDLTDDKWIYGGSDAAVFETIQDGRKGGMPSWRSELSRDDTWKVIAFIRSLHKK
jgi:mono/diheme cytochrome c family protein